MKARTFGKEVYFVQVYYKGNNHVNCHTEQFIMAENAKTYYERIVKRVGEKWYEPKWNEPGTIVDVFIFEAKLCEIE